MSVFVGRRSASVFRRTVAGVCAVAVLAGLFSATRAAPAAAAALVPPAAPPLPAASWLVPGPAAAAELVDNHDGVVRLAAATTSAAPPLSPASGPPSAMTTLSATAAKPDAAGEWPTGNHDRSRTGNAAWEEFVTVPAGGKWTSVAEDKVQVNPAVVGDTAYYGSAGTGRKVYAVDLQTGATKWTVQIPGSVLSSPTVSNGFVYFGGADGRIYRRSALNGSPSWQYPTSPAPAAGGFVGATAIHNGVLYAGSVDAKLYAIDATSGALLWSVTTPEAITAGVTVADGKILVVSGANEYLTAYDEASHAQVWQRSFYTWTDSTIVGTAASVSASRIYLTGLDGKLRMLNMASGTDIATPTLGSTAQNTPVTAAQKVFVGTNDGRVLAFNTAGTQQWATTLTGFGVVSSPVFAAGVVFASNTDGSLYGLDSETGTMKWRYVTGGSLFAPPAIVSNHILVGSDDHKLYGLVPGLPDAASYAPPPPRPHTYGIQPWQQYSWDPVSTSTGNYTYAATDTSIPGRGLPIGFTRAYNALDAATAGPLGYGWTFGDNISLAATINNATIRWGDGHTDTYALAAGVYTAPPDGHDTLTTVAGGGWDLTTVSHLRYRFDAAGKMAWAADPSGNQTTFTYDGSGRLSIVTDAFNRALTLAYNASNRISTVTDPMNRKWTYTYSGAGDLTSVADGASRTWRYGYDTAHRLTTMNDPDNNLVIRNTYDAQGRVKDQVDSVAGLWTYTYGTGTTTVTD